MKPTLLIIIASLLLAPLTTLAQQTTPPLKDQLVGDGIHDDTTSSQALLDSRRTVVHLPARPKHYLISKPLRIYSNQTLQLDRFAVIRLKDGSDCLMITNDDHERGNENIALVGGVWGTCTTKGSHSLSIRRRESGKASMTPHATSAC